MSNAFEEAVAKFGDLKVLVVGDVMLDVFEFCHTDSSKPIDSEKTGKRAYEVVQSPTAIGGAGNVAANLVSLGAKASLIGVTGNDGSYFTLAEIADKLEIEHTFVRDPHRPTTTKTRLYIDDEYQLRKDRESADKVGKEISLTLVSAALESISQVDAVILSDYNKGVFSENLASAILEACKEKQVPVVVDFKPPNREQFKGAYLLVPNENEADQLNPGFKGREGDDLQNAANALNAELGSENLVVTLGSRGICGCGQSTEFFHLPGNTVEEVDAVGCGDTVRAALALGCAAGLDLIDAADLANDAAAVIVQKPSTASLNSQELLDFRRAKGS